MIALSWIKNRFNGNDSPRYRRVVLFKWLTNATIACLNYVLTVCGHQTQEHYLQMKLTIVLHRLYAYLERGHLCKIYSSNLCATVYFINGINVDDTGLIDVTL